MTDINRETIFTADYWDERYGTADPVWSGQPNQRLVEQVADLRPGSALDLGCGEGADSVWLAEQGWTVLGADVSPIVIAKARTHAEQSLPADVAARITWQAADLLTWVPPSAAFDLASLQFLHLPLTVLTPVQARLADAVRPDGILLVVYHDHRDTHGSRHHQELPEMFPTVDEVATALDPERWEIELAEVQPRPGLDPDGNPTTRNDAVVRARRR
jgi:SAM-dependent methyltransferase